MEYQISGRNLEITDAMKNHALDKLAKLERFFDRISDTFAFLFRQIFNTNCLKTRTAEQFRFNIKA